MKYKAIIASDLHLGTEASKAKEFIKFLDEHTTELLILNGDIVDGWALARGQRWKSSHTQVISKLMDISRKTKIVWIRGNHDEFLHDFMTFHLGNICVAENYILELSPTQRYLIFHGDVLDVFITKWKQLAKIGSLGYDVALKINTWYNKYRAWIGKPYYSISKDIKAGVKAAVNYITDFEVAAVKFAKQYHCNGVMCGHIHKFEDTYILGTRYLNSGDWVENMSAIVVEHDNTVSVKEWRG